MRAHPMMTVAMIAGLAAACSADGSPEGDTSSAEAESARQLALPGDDVDRDAIVSDIEAGVHTTTAPVTSAATQPRAPLRTVVEPSAEAGEEPAIPDVNVYVVSAPARLSAPELTVERPVAGESVAAADEAGADATSLNGEGDRGTRTRGVIIRGGVTEGDDCKLHAPRSGDFMAPPRAGALVNQRGPRLGLPAIRGGGIR